MWRANSLEKDPDAGKDWGQKKVVSEDDLVRQHHWLSGRESEETPGRQWRTESLEHCSSWGCKELYVTEQEHEWMNVLGVNYDADDWP